MARLARLCVLTVSAAGLALGGRLAAGGPLGASLDAAIRAFRDPHLLDRPEPPPALDCRRFEADGAALDAQIAHDFERARDEDLDDPDGGTIRSLALPDLPIPITRRTLRYVRYFTRTDAGRAAFLARFRRSGLYRDHIEFALREAGLPEDLVWVPAIESGFDPRSLSPSGASGLWQFMPETAALYGLDQSEWVDERRSLGRATTAAVAHLRDLYERFHRWDLALAAYNVGFDGVVRAMDRFAEREGRRPSSFAELAGARLLPQETSSYVPEIHAFAIVAANRARFGLDRIELAQAPDLGELAVPAGTRLRTIARSAGIPTSALRDLNPQILRDRVPPTGGDYLVTLPADRVQHALATFPSYSEQEVVGQAEVDDVAPESNVPGALPSMGEDDPLPPRPHQLGSNRLPVIGGVAGPSEPRGPAALFANLSTFDAKLPMVLVGAGAGWREPSDPLGVFAGGGAVRGAKARDLALEKELGFLREPSRFDDLPAATLPGGVVLRMRKDPGAAFTSVTVRIASSDDARRAGLTSSEVMSTMTVGRKDADAAVELAASRVRIALGDAADAELAVLRRRAAEPRRRALASAPYGRAWLALSDALFPPGSPLAGAVVGAHEDGYTARESLLVDALGDERAHAKAAITVVGDVDEARARQLLTAFLGAPLASARPVAGPEREVRVRVDDEVPAPRALYGFLLP
ncbi:MAG TPA: lytic transglycosylase domain-containing protein, partial [Minicystis sp.]|nr:lytic transglycosylase domain-containing protein [Minicystis sp.]